MIKQKLRFWNWARISLVTCFQKLIDAFVKEDWNFSKDDGNFDVVRPENLLEETFVFLCRFTFCWLLIPAVKNGEGSLWKSFATHGVIFGEDDYKNFDFDHLMNSLSEVSFVSRPDFAGSCLASVSEVCLSSWDSLLSFSSKILHKLRDLNDSVCVSEKTVSSIFAIFNVSHFGYSNIEKNLWRILKTMNRFKFFQHISHIPNRKPLWQFHSLCCLFLYVYRFC